VLPVAIATAGIETEFVAIPPVNWLGCGTEVKGGGCCAAIAACVSRCSTEAAPLPVLAGSGSGVSSLLTGAGVLRPVKTGKEAADGRGQAAA